MKTSQELKKWLEKSIELFEFDPASSPYQEGYFNSLLDTLQYLLTE